ncbi:MAG: hypothetical protein HY785_12535 [Oscillatoriophycideae cyanobacterium NC_groundwater_1537_Pr4_S-0.65um_50_18]|nr:hypothetical protein [Oscillatoriophycideae cyanobacterium NC_groundwater_1537_Pr4_S-0.65um_50_18]
MTVGKDTLTLLFRITRSPQMHCLGQVILHLTSIPASPVIPNRPIVEGLLNTISPP